MNGPGAVCLVPVARSLVTESFMGSFDGLIKALSFLRGSADVIEILMILAREGPAKET